MHFCLIYMLCEFQLICIFVVQILDICTTDVKFAQPTLKNKAWHALNYILGQSKAREI